MKILNLTLSILLLATTAQAASFDNLNSLNSEFAMVDSNGDGSISKAELSNMMRGTLDVQNEQVMSKLDTNGDGTVSKSEYMTFYATMSGSDDSKEDLEVKFTQIDTNQDGIISGEEVYAFRQGNVHNDIDDLFTLLDSNNDGKISQQEFNTFFNQMKQMLNM